MMRNEYFGEKSGFVQSASFHAKQATNRMLTFMVAVLICTVIGSSIAMVEYVRNDAAKLPLPSTAWKPDFAGLHSFTAIPVRPDWR